MPSPQLLRLVVEDFTELVVRFLADGTITFVNDVYCRFFGKTRTELVGQKWYPNAVAEDLPNIRRQLLLLTPDNPVVVIENRVCNARGEIRWMQFINRALYDEQGEHVATRRLPATLPNARR